ncbi:hypothetical protein NUW54_g7240 [Trametes sanguinea]|uniref:Uncharacterized protein n=1 Tax=Trametes sanguinea TaxID=158606 RepID=A0ACC1PP89_9APHY|nr:hypothetical protein NUW54_g7240 [Trametes sanguinea]
MSNATLAGPPDECCRQTVHHVGTPRGTLEVIGGVNTYIARPPAGDADRVILFFSDVYGALYTNSQLLMDYWAENADTTCGLAGYIVLALDYFEGDSKALLNLEDESFDYPGWIKAHQARAKVLLPPWIEAVRERYGADKKYACVGYCFGAPYVMEHLKTDWIVAGAFGHPAFLDEEHFRGIKRESATICRVASVVDPQDTPGPLLMSCAEVDHTFPLELRAKGVSLSAASNWLWNWALAFATPYLVNSGKGDAGLGVKVFFIWGSTCVGCAVFTYFCIAVQTWNGCWRYTCTDAKRRVETARRIFTDSGSTKGRDLRALRSGGEDGLERTQCGMCGGRESHTRENRCRTSHFVHYINYGNI